MKLSVGKLYKMHSNAYPSIGLWERKFIWSPRLKKSVPTYKTSGHIVADELFVVLTHNSIGEPFVVSKSGNAGLIYFGHLNLKEFSFLRVRDKD